MAKIFLSHSSSDKDFVRRLANGLKSRGHEVWLDEWQIRVGQCIPTRIEEGLQESDLAIVILSPRSCASPWVDREWKSKYWEELRRREVLVLPVLLEDCDLPELLKTKRYADFRRDYEAGFSELLGALSSNEPPVADQRPSTERFNAAFDLLQRVQARAEPLSLIMTDILRQASTLDDRELIEFARSEVSGYKPKPGVHDISDLMKPVEHRHMAGYISLHQINPSFMGWSDGLGAALSCMRQNPKEFKPFTVGYPDPIVSIESQLPSGSHKKLLHLVLPGHLFSGAPPNSELNFYAAGDTLQAIYERIRLRLVKLLSTLAMPPRELGS